MVFSLFSRPSDNNMDAIEMLMDDHARVKELFKSFKDLEDSDDDLAMFDIATTACLDLMVHSKLEEEIFYPAVRSAATKELEELLGEAEVEHETIDTLVERLLSSPLADEEYKANFTVVMEYVEHHVKEEEDEMFPQIRALNLDLKTIAGRMRTRQAALVEEIAGDSNIASMPRSHKDGGAQMRP